MSLTQSQAQRRQRLQSSMRLLSSMQRSLMNMHQSMSPCLPHQLSHPLQTARIGGNRSIASLTCSLARCTCCDVRRKLSVGLAWCLTACVTRALCHK